MYLEVDPDPDEPADVIGDEPIWHDGADGDASSAGSRRAPTPTTAARSLALGYVPAELADPGADVRDRDHRPAPPGPPAHRAGGRPGRRADAGLNEPDGSPTPTSSGGGAARRASCAYLAEHGLANVSLRPMARALGVSVNALVHHFGSKDELVVAALRRAADVQARRRGAVAGPPPELSRPT